ncbi:MAG: hypothetical protein ACYS7Y_16520 [Planctomycetota bacterium]|jgi:hypothetical protein
MTCRADRNIIYSLVNNSIDDAQGHLRSAYNHAFNIGDTPLATDHCLRAIGMIHEAEEYMAVSSDIISSRKKSSFEADLQALQRALWCMTKDISALAKSCYADWEATSVLRLHFLAYSCDPQDDAKGAEIAGLHW